MKRIIVFVLLAVLGVYLTGRIRLGESGAMDFLIAMENLTNNGKADEACAMFHDELQVSIADNTVKPPKQIDGGKDELCDLTHEAVDALRKMPHSMHVEWTDFEIQRSWLHPWTSEITYTEDRSLSLRGVNVTIRTTSDNTMTLVNTLSGVKLKKLDSEAWVAE